MFNVQSDGYAVGDGITDDTLAIQDAIDTATAGGTRSATVYFPPGEYVIDGPLTDTGAFNAQVLLPDVATSQPQIQLRFKGAAQGPFMFAGPRPDPSGYSILRSTLTGATGTAAVFSGGNGTWQSKTNIAVGLENLICLTPDNPSMTFWNLSNTQASGNPISGVFILPDVWGPSSEPTHPNAYAIKLPQQGQANYGNVNGLGVGGFYTGVLVGELSVVRGLNVGLCKVAVEIPGLFHPFLIVNAVNAGCETGIKVTGEAYGDILQWDTEHHVSPSPAWQRTDYDLSDPGDDLHGHIRWYSFEGNTLTRDHSFTVSGGANVTHEEIGQAPSTAPHSHGGGGGSSAEIAYSQITSAVANITATSEAQAQTIVTGTAMEFDGSPVNVTFSAPHAQPPSGAAGRSMIFWLFDGSTSLGALGAIITPATSAMALPVHCSRRLTLSGTHTLSVRASVSAGTGQVHCGTGGAGQYPPAFLRVTT